MAIDWSKKLDQIGDAIKDLATLDVVTLSGQLDQTIADKNGVLKDWSAYMGGGAGAAAGKIQLIAATKIEIDADTTNFVTSTQPENLDDLLKIHKDAVAASMESRRAAIEFVKGMAQAVL